MITGAQPGAESINNRVSVPSVLWSSFCCYNQKRNQWLGNTFWGHNGGDGPVGDIHVSKLQEPIGGQKYDLFTGTNCPQDKTAVEVIKQIKDNCNCPWFRK